MAHCDGFVFAVNVLQYCNVRFVICVMQLLGPGLTTLQIPLQAIPLQAPFRSMQLDLTPTTLSWRFRQVFCSSSAGRLRRYRGVSMSRSLCSPRHIPCRRRRSRLRQKRMSHCPHVSRAGPSIPLSTRRFYFLRGMCAGRPAADLAEARRRRSRAATASPWRWRQRVAWQT